MELNLAGKTALVTGASRGIGLATVRTLTEEGVRVVGVARTPTPELEKTGALAMSADLSTDEGVRQMADRALAELEGVDLLVNNVGGGDAIDLAGFLDIDDAQWASIFDLNLFSAVRASRAVLPSLLERRGAIVNISSINSRLPAAGPVAYSAAKAALTAVGKSLSEEFGPRGVRVNTVSPTSCVRASGRTQRGSAPELPPRREQPTRSSSPGYRRRSRSRQVGSPSPRRSRHSLRSFCPMSLATSPVRTTSSTGAP